MRSICIMCDCRRYKNSSTELLAENPELHYRFIACLTVWSIEGKLRWRVRLAGDLNSQSFRVRCEIGRNEEFETFLSLRK